MAWTPHDPDMPSLVDSNPYPSATIDSTNLRASYGSQPDIHSAFPGLAAHSLMLSYYHDHHSRYNSSPWSAPPWQNTWNTPSQSPYTPLSSWGAPLSASGYPSYTNTPNSQLAFYPPPLTANSYFNAQPQLQLVRSNSFGGSLRRSSSYGGDYGGLRRYDSYHEQNLARRPLEWRADFTMSSGISAYVPRIGKNRSSVQGMSVPPFIPIN